MRRLLPVLLLAMLLFPGCSGPEAVIDTAADGTVLLRPDFARRGNTVFFTANDTLYRMALDGSNRTKVADGCSAIADVTDTEVFYLWRGEVTRVCWDGSGKTVLADDAWGLAGCSDGWIYYTDYDETSLVRVSRDGKRKEYFKGMCTWPVLPDGKSVVFTKTGVLYSLADDGAQPEKLLDGVSQVCRRGDNAFAVKKDGIMKVSLADKSVTRLAEGQAWNIRTDGSRVYYLSRDGNLCSVKTDGLDPVKLTQDRISTYVSVFDNRGEYYTVENGWAYYLGKDKRLYRVSGDGKRTQRLTESTVCPVEVAGGQITYINSEYGPEDTDYIQIHSEAILRRMNADGTGGRAKDLTGSGLNTSAFLAIGEYLYLDRYTEPEQKLYRVRKDGQGREATGNQVSESIFGDIRFFTKRDGKGIFCSNADGSGEYRLCPQFGWDFAYEGGWLYFHNRDGIWRVNKDSPGEARCLQPADVMEFTVSGGKIYYPASGSEQGILAINADGTGLLRIAGGDSVRLIGAGGGWVYYSKGISSKNAYVIQIRRIRPDGTGDHLILAGDGRQIESPALAGGWIYYSNNKIPGRFNRVNCETGGVQFINKHHAFDIRSDGQYVYYIKDQTDGIWRVPLAGGEAQCVVSEPVNVYRLNGDWVDYQTSGRTRDIEVVRFR